ncbi:MAG: FAD-dependent monooxygenase [Bacteroidota bacterium]|nr:FAD-dependent monooxygenase [Bacteroidota bacterium]MDP4231754.1 FAD-dependent monooxygenase [Bacteroidota bacterium]MDP4243490.1 FAD-dependent monooxygenase [Bacteroidota bacterium]MDP4287091.1 FAD-dependent monooxygenase [Bacteroidota bacterium]
MRIAIIGGGPAGLYFALLVKKWRPDIQVDLFERNGPDDTFGWGVVFSDKTLSYLKVEDAETHDEIVRRFETWDNVNVVHHDELVTIRGNKFSGIARIEILHILQARCRSLGVNLHFRSPVTDPTELKSYDLLVGADGVMSVVRSRFEDAFKPDLSTRPNRYIWYGTPHLFHGLTLTFRENSAGVFAAHSYKFSKSLSTFIVECDEETWATAGFHDMDDDSTRAYLEAVFHLDLAGSKLLSNNSKWINFVLVRNRHWSHENVVLLGDSLATAHFSIGSGTKLALEDSISLFHALRLNERIPDALIAFEAQRRPAVEALQDAAYESLIFFENLKDYMHLDPVPFAYKLMTRSGRVDDEKLRQRDPKFAERVFASR